MLKNIILEFDDDAELLETDDIFQYQGKKDFSKVRALEAIADTREMSLSFLGDLFPSLEKLRLNNSIIPSVRDISSNMANLKFLSLAHCEIQSLDGIGTISEKLEELYLAFNHISEFSDLMGLENLRILDLEENNIKNLADVELLSTCGSLRALTMFGNPAAESETYRSEVMKFVPKLVYLDEKRLRPRKSPQKEKPKELPPPILIQDKPISDSVDTKSSVRFATKIQKGEKCGVKPRTSDQPKRETTITEYVEDAINERPPTSHGSYNEKKIMENWLKPVNIKSPIAAKASAMPKITRPVSSCMRSRTSKA